MTLVDVEVTSELCPISVEAGRDGIAVIARRHGRPIGFWMEDLPAGTTLSPTELGRRVVHHAGSVVLFDELCPSPAVDSCEASVTVAICTKDRPAGLARCLAALEPLRKAARDRDMPFDVLVVDNASTRSEVREVAESNGARCVREARAGLDFARNRALLEARGSWLVFFDDDVVVDPAWIDGMADALSVHPDAAAITGLVLPFALDTDAQVLFERRGGFRQGFLPHANGPVHMFELTYPAGAGYFGTGANTAVRVDVARAIGGFDEALDTGAPLPGGGDLDLYYRLVRAGHTVLYQPSCLVFHEHRRDLVQLRRQFHDSWGLSFHAFLAKCWRMDPAMRSAHRRYLSLWYRSMAREIARSAFGRTEVSVSMLAAEVVGAARGICGEYGRSQRRSAAIRRSTP